MKILFVCTGNICRSPLAEGLFRKLAYDAGLGERFLIDSAGTSGYHVGEAPHPDTNRLAKEHGISLDGKRSRQVTVEDVASFDWLIAMDRSHVEALQSLAPQLRTKIHLLLDYAESDTKDVHDPYFDGDFAKTYNQVNTGCRGLLKFLTQAHART